MFVDVTLTSKNGATGRGLVELDFTNNKYAVEPYQGWGNTGFSVFGTFSLSQGTLVLVDQNTPQYGNKLLLRNGPLNERDAAHWLGDGSVESPLNPRFADATLTWKTGSALRKKILDIVDRLAGFNLWPSTQKDFPSGSLSRRGADCRSASWTRGTRLEMGQAPPGPGRFLGGERGCPGNAADWGPRLQFVPPTSTRGRS